ncbi:hypothetical protein BC831DRAFT_305067 [Entophlyctis helioformis]|nr:hypothetical protein BC831DRAFT_305067 [Entophlyctis helioformis]
MSSLVAAVEEGAVVVNAEVCGELVVCILLLFVFHGVLQKSATYSSRTMPITVGEFLNGLFGTDALGEAAAQYLQSMDSTNRTRASQSAGATMGPIDPEFLDGIVAFNHYMFVRNGQSNDTLQGAFDRFAAILCKVNQKAVDIVLPVYLPSRDCFSAILVQVKNQSAKVSAQEAQEITDAAADFSFGEDTPYLVLFLSIHRDDPSLMFLDRDAEHANRSILMAHGLAGLYDYEGSFMDKSILADLVCLRESPRMKIPRGNWDFYDHVNPFSQVQSASAGLGSGAMSGPSGASLAGASEAGPSSSEEGVQAGSSANIASASGTTRAATRQSPGPARGAKRGRR